MKTRVVFILFFRFIFLLLSYFFDNNVFVINFVTYFIWPTLFYFKLKLSEDLCMLQSFPISLIYLHSNVLHSLFSFQIHAALFLLTSTPIYLLILPSIFFTALWNNSVSVKIAISDRNPLCFIFLYKINTTKMKS